MSTKSILKSVNIKSKRDIQRFITALEKAKTKRKHIAMSKSSSDATREDIRKMFGKTNDRV